MKSVGEGSVSVCVFIRDKFYLLCAACHLLAFVYHYHDVGVPPYVQGGREGMKISGMRREEVVGDIP